MTRQIITERIKGFAEESQKIEDEYATKLNEAWSESNYKHVEMYQQLHREAEARTAAYKSCLEMLERK